MTYEMSWDRRIEDRENAREDRWKEALLYLAKPRPKPVTGRILPAKD